VVRVVNRFDGLDLFAELVSHPVSEGDVLVRSDTTSRGDLCHSQRLMMMLSSCPRTSSRTSTQPLCCQLFSKGYKR